MNDNNDDDDDNDDNDNNNKDDVDNDDANTPIHRYIHIHNSSKHHLL
jgi:hypothetical protein